LVNDDWLLAGFELVPGQNELMTTTPITFDLSAKVVLGVIIWIDFWREGNPPARFNWHRPQTTVQEPGVASTLL